jgi:putative ABC transport system permease protein
VNETLVRRFFRGEQPVGRILNLPTFSPNFGGLGKAAPHEIVGIAGDVKSEQLREAAPFQIYLPMAQDPVSFVAVAVRTNGDPAALALAARREIAAEDRDLPADEMKSMEARLGQLLSGPRLAIAVFTGFAALALLLSGLGIYGVMSYTVARRAQEIGVRIAMGAGTGGILRLVLRESTILAGWGLGLGWAATFAGRRVVESELFGIHATDPASLAGVSAGVLALTLAAALIPARAAAKLDPATSLRTE